jgi:hypothetical protein
MGRELHGIGAVALSLAVLAGCGEEAPEVGGSLRVEIGVPGTAGSVVTLDDVRIEVANDVELTTPFALEMEVRTAGGEERSPIRHGPELLVDGRALDVEGGRLVMGALEYGPVTSADAIVIDAAGVHVNGEPRQQLGRDVQALEGGLRQHLAAGLDDRVGVEPLVAVDLVGAPAPREAPHGQRSLLHADHRADVVEQPGLAVAQRDARDAAPGQRHEPGHRVAGALDRVQVAGDAQALGKVAVPVLVTQHAHQQLGRGDDDHVGEDAAREQPLAGLQRLGGGRAHREDVDHVVAGLVALVAAPVDEVVGSGQHVVAQRTHDLVVRAPLVRRVLAQVLEQQLLLERARHPADQDAAPALVAVLHVALQRVAQDPVDLDAEQRLPGDQVRDLDVRLPRVLRALGRQRHAAGRAEDHELGAPVQVVVELVERAFDEEVVHGHDREARIARVVGHLPERADRGHAVGLGDLEADVARPRIGLRHQLGVARLELRRLALLLGVGAVDALVEHRRDVGAGADVGRHRDDEVGHRGPRLLGAAERPLLAAADGRAAVVVHADAHELGGELAPHPLRVDAREQREVDVQRRRQAADGRELGPRRLAVLHPHPAVGGDPLAELGAARFEVDALLGVRREARVRVVRRQPAVLEDTNDLLRAG